MSKRCSVLIMMAVFFASTGALAVSTREIDAVRDKAVLNESDFAVIDAFVRDVVDEMLRMRDFGSIAKTRLAIVGRRTSAAAQNGEQGQYYEQFTESSQRHLSRAFEEVGNISPADKQAKMLANLIILVGELENARLMSIVLPYVMDERQAIQYLAITTLTNPDLVVRAQADGQSALLARVNHELTSAVGDACPESLTAIAAYAANMENAAGDDLLARVADERIGQYAGWAVEKELADAAFLKYLYKRIEDSGGKNQELAQRFGQLLSFVFQRYLQGQDALTAGQKQGLVATLVEVEKACISELLGLEQVIIKTTIENGDLAALAVEHDRLLGGQNGEGKLVGVLEFSYDGTGQGQANVPKKLPQREES